MLYDIAERIYALESEGKKITRLNVGEPDWRPPASVSRALLQAIKQGRDRYGSSAGDRALRERIAELHGARTENVLVTPGSKWGVFAGLYLAMKPGDNIIVFSPHWTAYELMARQLGGEARIIPGQMEKRFAVDWDAMERAANARTKFLILNSPSNPTSVAMSEREENELLEWARARGIRVMADDAYRDLCFDRRKERPMEEGLTTVHSFSKTFGMTGWRIGYSVTAKETVERLTKLNQITITNVPPFIQAAAMEVLHDKSKLAERARRTCQKRAAMAKRIVGKKLDYAEPDAGFYIFPRLPAGVDTKNYIEQLLERGVAVVPGQAFGAYSQHIRVSLAAEEKALERALQQMTDALESTDSQNK